jgi:hypothetical protein
MYADDSSASTHDYCPVRIVGEIGRFNGEKWICEKIRMPSDRDSTVDIKLHLGGRLKIFLNMINAFDQIEVEEELMEDPRIFREYKIQGGLEPRAHLLFHKKARDGAGESQQPGYRYGSTRMKAISFKGFPSLERI